MRYLGSCLLALAAIATAQSLPALYQSVLSPTEDDEQVAAVEQVRFARDALHFTLHDGFLALTQPVAGHVTAAVFSGHGELDVAAPTPGEAVQMQRFLGAPTIAVPFTAALFRFPDDAWFLAALGAQVRFQPNPRGAALAGIIAARAKREADQGWPDAARVLQGVFAPDPEAVGPFFADLKTARYGWIQAVFDPLEQEEVEVHRLAQAPRTGLAVFDDVWTQFERAADRSAGVEAAHKRPELLSLDNYRLGVTIPHDLDMSVVANLTVQPRVAFGPGIFLTLDSNLRLTSASTAAGQRLEWIQPRDPGRLRPPAFRGDWIYLQLPRGVGAAPVSLRLAFHGKYVIQRVGDGNFFARSEGWYPSYPFGTPFHYARFDLLFHCEKRYSVVATGLKVTDTVSGKVRTEEFRPTVPITVAGFAFGQYRERQTSVTLDGHPVQVEVFTNTQPDDAMAAINNFGSIPSLGPRPQLLPGLQNLDPLALQPLVLQEVANSLRFFDFLFGPYPYRKLAVANIPGSYGQGWPSLLYLSSLSFLDSTQLHDLGASSDALRQVSETFRAHETSHQWWGHLVSWASPRDQWLSEGFADASALLYENARYGPKESFATLQTWRRDLLRRDRFGQVPVDEGPVWLGDRLISTLDPTAYSTVVYDKGGYILYMLREMMLDPRARQHDARFIAMMRDFTHTYAGRATSTADFEAVVNRYMTPAMDLGGNHRMDWFFDEYVYGADVPRVRFSYTIAPAAKGSHLTLRFHQEPAAWKELLPIYVHFGKKNVIRGMVRLRQADETIAVNLPFVARSAAANELDDMLVEVTH